MTSLNDHIMEVNNEEIEVVKNNIQELIGIEHIVKSIVCL
jgi:hypothetical protein